MELIPRTIVDYLGRLEECTLYGARFVSRSGEATFPPTRVLNGRRRRRAHCALGLEPGDGSRSSS
jgi:hypothetical protein